MSNQKMLLYRRIEVNAHNGNWSDASKIGFKSGFDAYSLIECYEKLDEIGANLLSMRDIAILSMYIERLRCESKS